MYGLSHPHFRSSVCNYISGCTTVGHSHTEICTPGRNHRLTTNKCLNRFALLADRNQNRANVVELKCVRHRKARPNSNSICMDYYSEPDCRWVPPPFLPFHHVLREVFHLITTRIDVLWNNRFKYCNDLDLHTGVWRWQWNRIEVQQSSKSIKYPSKWSCPLLEVKASMPKLMQVRVIFFIIFFFI